MGWWVLLAIGSVTAMHGKVAPSIGVFLGALVVCYLFSLARHPRRVCRACGGSGRHVAAMFPWADRACTTCGGSPRHRRWGVQALYGDKNARTWGERAPAEARSRRGAPR